MKSPLICAALASLLLSACSTQPISRSTYLLRPANTMQSGPLASPSDDYLADLVVASYIDQPGLVLEQSTGTLHTAKYHQWAEPLRVSLRDFLSIGIAAKLGRPLGTAPSPSGEGSRIEVRISQLHGDADGNAVLVAYWSLLSGKQRRDYQFAEIGALQGVGYEALVAAETQLLLQLAQAIASELQ
jgi:uncharacterized lipoprotein YmbA